MAVVDRIVAIAPGVRYTSKQRSFAIPNVNKPAIKTPPESSLWFHSNFRKLWIAQAISAFGSRISRDGLPALATLVLSATTIQLGMLNAAALLPNVVLGLFAGVLVDRMQRRSVMIVSDFVRALALASIPLAWWFTTLHLWHLYTVAAVAAFFTLLFQVSDNAYLPQLIGRERLLEGNAKLATTDSVAEVGGPALGGMLIQVSTHKFLRPMLKRFFAPLCEWVTSLLWITFLHTKVRGP